MSYSLSSSYLTTQEAAAGICTTRRRLMLGGMLAILVIAIHRELRLRSTTSTSIMRAERRSLINKGI